MLRKRMAVLLALTLCMLTLVSCGAPKKSESPAPAKESAAEDKRTPDDAESTEAMEKAESKEEAAADEAAADEAFSFDRTIKIIVPFGRGGDSDTSIRAWSIYLAEALGTDIEVENIAGESGVLGAEALKKAAADGYTYAAFTPSLSIAAAKNAVSYDLMEEIVPVVQILRDYNVLSANSGTGRENLDDFIALSSERPLKIGMMSATGLDNASVIQLAEAAGFKYEAIEFTDMDEAIADLRADKIDLLVSSVFTLIDEIKAQEVIGIISLSEHPLALAPDIPTSASMGYDAYLGPLRGLVAIKGTPQEAIDAIVEAAEGIEENSDWIAWKDSMGLAQSDAFATGEEFEAIWRQSFEDMKVFVEATD